MLVDEGEEAIATEPVTREHHPIPRKHGERPARSSPRRQPQRLPAERASVATGSATVGGIALLVILAAVGAILIARRQSARQSLLPDLRKSPSGWWRAVADAERNLEADFRRYFNK